MEPMLRINDYKEKLRVLSLREMLQMRRRVVLEYFGDKT
jgi:uncharacterized protein with HEPN domain